MLVYRVFPHLPSAAPAAPGHAGYLHPGRGGGRLDNPARYSVWYLSYDACGAIGEVFGNQQNLVRRDVRLPRIAGQPTGPRDVCAP